MCKAQSSATFRDFDGCTSPCAGFPALRDRWSRSTPAFPQHSRGTDRGPVSHGGPSMRKRLAKPLFSSVLCPVDFSNHSAAALRFAGAAARRARAPLEVLYVDDPLLVAAAAAAYDERALGAASERELRRFVSSSLPPAAIREIRTTFATALGKPAREILRTVERSGHDLVVVGTKGWNGARRLLLGSTTSEILRRARVPVLAVPPAEVVRSRRTAVPASWPGGTVV